MIKLIYFNTSQQLENLCKALAEFTTGSKITNMLDNLNLNEIPQQPNDTKWKRLHTAFCNSQNSSKSSAKIIQCIEWIICPQNFINDKNAWTDAKSTINKVIQFNGLEINDSGKVIQISKPKNYCEAYKRYSSLKNKLDSFNIHPRILSICNQELLSKDYYSLIFESSKLVIKKIQEISDYEFDGINLINKCFDSKNPVIVLNSLSTNQEKNLYFSLKAMLNLIIYMYRNPKAHDLKAYDTSSEKDAIEALILISKALTLLDDCSKSSIH